MTCVESLFILAQESVRSKVFDWTSLSFCIHFWINSKLVVLHLQTRTRPVAFGTVHFDIKPQNHCLANADWCESMEELLSPKWNTINEWTMVVFVGYSQKWIMSRMRCGTNCASKSTRVRRWSIRFVFSVIALKRPIPGSLPFLPPCLAWLKVLLHNATGFPRKAATS